MCGQNVHKEKRLLNDHVRTMKMFRKLMHWHRACGHPANSTLKKTLEKLDGHGLTTEELELVPDLPECSQCAELNLQKHRGAKKANHENMCPP